MNKKKCAVMDVKSIGYMAYITMFSMNVIIAHSIRTGKNLLLIKGMMVFAAINSAVLILASLIFLYRSTPKSGEGILKSNIFSREVLNNADEK